MKLTRRQLLAGIGVTGTASFGGRALRREPAYTHYTYAQTDETGIDLRVAWYERYNGQRLERTPGGLSLTDNTTWEDAAAEGEYVNVGKQRTSDEVLAGGGPVIHLDDVLPGDTGTLVVGLHSELAPASVTLRAGGPGPDGGPVFAENGRNEPESKVDATPDASELGDDVQVTVWYDDGIAGFGAADGRRPLGGFVEQVIVAGSLRSVLADLAEGVPLDAYGCFERGTPRYVGFSWHLPDDVGNRVQGDSASFGLVFDAVACERGEASEAVDGGSA